MNNYKLTIQYDGGRYDGWSRQGKEESTNTVEKKIIEVLSKMSGENVELFCGCRTEKGVHAVAQVANFKMEKQMKPLDIRNYLVRYLPRDISVTEVEAVDERFHSQLNAKAKTYVYRLDIGNIANVFERRYAYHTFDRPDFKAMRKAADYFIGEHDFKALTTAKKSKSSIKRIDAIEIIEDGDRAVIKVTANDFLHNMARLVIGMIMDAGSGLRKPEDVRRLLDGENIQVSLPAESYGLFLESVLY